MKIITETGSVYTIKNGDFCVKTDADGNRVDAFKVFMMKAVPETPISWEELADTPNTNPVVGQHLYIAGKDTWWLTTKVVSVELDSFDD